MVGAFLGLDGRPGAKSRVCAAPREPVSIPAGKPIDARAAAGLSRLFDTQTRTHRIAESVRLDQSPQRLAQSRVFVAERAPAAALTADAPGRQRRRVQIVLAAIDRRARQPRNLGNQRQPAAPSRPDRRRREQPTPARVQLAPQRLPSNPDRRRINHKKRLTPPARQKESLPKLSDSIIPRSLLCEISSLRPNSPKSMRGFGDARFPVRRRLENPRDSGPFRRFFDFSFTIFQICAILTFDDKAAWGAKFERGEQG
jgi:hypothetical protein